MTLVAYHGFGGVWATESGTFRDELVQRNLGDLALVLESDLSKGNALAELFLAVVHLPDLRGKAFLRRLAKDHEPSGDTVVMSVKFADESDTEELDSWVRHALRSPLPAEGIRVVCFAASGVGVDVLLYDPATGLRLVAQG
jgi:hypothetical protein